MMERQVGMRVKGAMGKGFAPVHRLALAVSVCLTFLPIPVLASASDLPAAAEPVARDVAVRVYPGPLAIEMAPDLDDEQRQVEARAVFALQQDVSGFVKRYRERFGTYLSADEAKELFDDYCASGESRSRFAPAVHMASQRLVTAVWYALLAERRIQADAFVLFTAGGPGAGKTTMLETEPEAQALKQAARIVADSTFAYFPFAERSVQDALSHGYRVVIVYVHRSIEEAVAGVVERALESGRVVPVKVVADKGFQALETLVKLAEQYRHDPRCRFVVIDNRGPIGTLKPRLGFGELARHRLTLPETRRRASVALEAIRRARGKAFSALLYDELRRGLEKSD